MLMQFENTNNVVYIYNLTLYQNQLKLMNPSKIRYIYNFLWFWYIE